MDFDESIPDFSLDEQRRQLAILTKRVDTLHNAIARHFDASPDSFDSATLALMLQRSDEEGDQFVESVKADRELLRSNLEARIRDDRKTIDNLKGREADSKEWTALIRKVVGTDYCGNTLRDCFIQHYNTLKEQLANRPTLARMRDQMDFADPQQDAPAEPEASSGLSPQETETANDFLSQMALDHTAERDDLRSDLADAEKPRLASWHPSGGRKVHVKFHTAPFPRLVIADSDGRELAGGVILDLRGNGVLRYAGLRAGDIETDEIGAVRDVTYPTESRTQPSAEPEAKTAKTVTEVEASPEEAAVCKRCDLSCSEYNQLSFSSTSDVTGTCNKWPGSIFGHPNCLLLESGTEVEPQVEEEPGEAVPTCCGERCQHFTFAGLTGTGRITGRCHYRLDGGTVLGGSQCKYPDAPTEPEPAETCGTCKQLRMEDGVESGGLCRAASHPTWKLVTQKACGEWQARQ